MRPPAVARHDKWHRSMLVVRSSHPQFRRAGADHGAVIADRTDVLR
jgi:hypothetical protein